MGAGGCKAHNWTALCWLWEQEEGKDGAAFEMRVSAQGLLVQQSALSLFIVYVHITVYTCYVCSKTQNGLAYPIERERTRTIYVKVENARCVRDLTIRTQGRQQYQKTERALASMYHSWYVPYVEAQQQFPGKIVVYSCIPTTRETPLPAVGTQNFHDPMPQKHCFISHK